VLSVVYIVYTHKQNRAYAAALLDLLREDRIHLLDLNDDDLRHLDASAVAAISARLTSGDEEVRLATVLLSLHPEHFRQIVLEDPAMSFEIFRAFSAHIWRFDEAMQAVRV